MDKKANIQRIYYLRYLGKDSICTLIQDSRLEGEYGPVSILCACEMDGPHPNLRCDIAIVSGTSVEQLYSIRNNEMLHFVLNILPLFNPLTFNQDALSFQEKE